MQEDFCAEAHEDENRQGELDFQQPDAAFPHQEILQMGKAVPVVDAHEDNVARHEEDFERHHDAEDEEGPDVIGPFHAVLVQDASLFFRNDTGNQRFGSLEAQPACEDEAGREQHHRKDYPGHLDGPMPVSPPQMREIQAGERDDGRCQQLDQKMGGRFAIQYFPQDEVSQRHGGHCPDEQLHNFVRGAFAGHEKVHETPEQGHESRKHI